MLYAMFITLIIQMLTLFNFLLGNKFLLSFDGINQYLHFYNELSNIVQNNESLFWTWRQGVGANFFGSMTYYLLSPVMIILALISNKELMPYLFVVSFIIKQQIAVVAMYSLLKNFKIERWICILISLCWAFNAYFIHYTSNPMWLDILYLLPLIFLGINRIRQHKKCLLFIVAVALTAIRNYYIFFSASIFVYLYLFISYFVYENKFRFKGVVIYFIKMTGYYLIGVGIAAVILIPSVMAIKESPRGQSTMLLDTIFKLDFSMLINSLKSSFFNTSTDFNVVFAQQALLYSGSLMTISLPLLFTSKINIPNKIRVLIGGTLFVEVLSIISPFLYLVFHGLAQPICFPFRFMYGFIALNLIILAYILNLLFKSNYKISKYYVVFLILYPLILLQEKGIVIVAFNILIFTIYYVSVNYRKKYLILGMTIVELLISTTLIFNYYSANYLSKEQYEQWFENNEVASLISDVNKIKENNLERIFENFDLNDSERLRNMALTYSYSGLNTFTSTDNELYLKFLNTLTLNDNSSGIVNLTGNLMSNQVLNVKYLILSNESPIPYGYELIAEQLNYSLYENKNYLGGGYLVSNFIKESTFTSLNQMEKELVLINNVVVSDNSNIVENYSQNIAYQIIQIEDIKTNLQEVSNNQITTQEIEDPYIEFTLTPLSYSSSEIFMYLSSNNKVKKIEIIDQDRTYTVSSGDFTHSVRLKDIGCYTSTPRIKVYLNEDTEYTINELIFYEVDMLSYQTELDKMNARSLDNISMNKNKVLTDVLVDEENYLYLSIPYSQGWEANSNGSSSQLQSANLSFLLLDLEEGLNRVELTYYSPGFKIGTLISIVSLIILNITMFVTKRKKVST